MAENICFICEGVLEEHETRTVQKKGVASLISASRARRDHKSHVYNLTDKVCITVHPKCYLSYIDTRLITACKAKKGAQTSTTSTRSTSIAFDFEKNCLLCGTDASESFVKNQLKKKNPSRRQIVILVQEKQFIERIVQKSGQRSDQWGSEVLSRTASTLDLTTVKARYHNLCYPRFLNAPAGSSADQLKDTPHIVDMIERFIRDHPDERQFSMKTIINDYEGQVTNKQWLKKKLYEKLGDEIMITSNVGAEPIIYLRDACHKILLKNYQETQNEEPDRLKVVIKAAKIVTEDIRSKGYDVNSYPSPNSFLENAEEVVPNSLRVFLDNVILSGKRGKDEGKFFSKILAIAHTIISCARPRSFISCVKIGLGAVLSKRFGSKTLLNILSSLGFCCSYDEALLFEASVLSEPNNSTIDTNSFSQFVFDNADHNTNTIDGLHTFHVMGGIETVTPRSAVSCFNRIPKLKAIPPRDTIGSFGTLALKVFHGYKKAGLGNVSVENLDVMNPNVRYDFDISSADFLWIYNQKVGCIDIQGWNGFMENLTENRAYDRSRIVCMPFLNHPPSNYDTIHTVLRLAAQRLENKKQKIAFVTFDQPLYWKAKEIIHSTQDTELQNVVVRLGGFHLAMSYLGSIGNIMDGSGLKEVISEIYAPASVDKMLAGHAYARAVRAHILIHCALVQIVLSSTNFTEDDSLKLQTILENPDKIFENIDSDVEFKNIKVKFIATVNSLAGRSETAKLWVQYLQMVSLLKMFIEAERSSNWKLHLETVQRMLPFFHSSGHFLYAKSAHLYLQDMYDLRSRMDEAEYQDFVNGRFTIRRTDKFWSGIWSDMTIEQELMKYLKSHGGPTRGRGMTDSVLSKWQLISPAIVNLTETLTDFLNVFLATTEQHVDARATRIARDLVDIKKVLSWFVDHDPFPETKGIISLSTGFKGGDDDNIDCYLALEIGLRCLTNMWQANGDEGPKTFGGVKYKRKNKIISLKTLFSTVKVCNKKVAIDPSLLFQRICVLKKSDEELKAYFNYELAPYPLALFDERGLRHTPKSKLYDFFIPVESPIAGNDVYVIDGGFLLHKVVWQQKEIFNDISTRYINYLKNNYPNCIIVFDGYPDNAEEKHIKSAERFRRSRVNYAPEVVCEINMPSSLTQENFLSNEKNKVHLINILSRKMRDEGFVVKQAVEDADTVIIDAAISVSDKYDTVYVVGEDVDLLVILTQIAEDRKNIYIFKPSRGNVEQKLYSVDSFKYPNIKHLIGFIHAFTGCDTTSALYKQGKAKLIKLLSNGSDKLQKEASTFNNPDALKNSIYAAGQSIIMALYGTKDTATCSFEDFRYRCFTKSTLKSTFNLSCLPPTCEASNEHSLRTYLQVQIWLGDRNRDPMQWGWKKASGMLVPIPTRKDPIPRNLLEIISCGCSSSNCTSNCTCKKLGMKCTVLCRKCNGISCANVFEPEIILSDDDEIDNDVPKLTDSDDDGVDIDQSIRVESPPCSKKRPSTSRGKTRVAKKNRLP